MEPKVAVSTPVPVINDRQLGRGEGSQLTNSKLVNNNHFLFVAQKWCDHHVNCYRISTADQAGRTASTDRCN